ncbi:conserved hypothetical protein [Theileria orientalis strain Shintoku]|uniref:Uncharacterized protein n=1 Tax=Theileria orientalis strain Shintoku TaxID=869250 RepID=J4C7T7_THEOR|nr:conserved hypothetical protein [Theileria orientalis strain Shintoku]BAM39608.1 conserved hypothetical protein [Theileria orientalis strain Shintoku]|eukprot:XP_009689909.1 conserved hypothetical protein [Theileria orientalis strain Shintoku]
MSNFDKLNRLKSFNERNGFVSNADKLISCSIKRQLYGTDHSYDGYTQISGTDVDVDQENEELGLKNDSPYSGHGQTGTSSYDSDEDSDSYDDETTSYSDDSEEQNKSPDSVESKSPQTVKSQNPGDLNSNNGGVYKDEDHDEYSKGSSNNDLKPKDGIKFGNDNEYLKNVFSNLENQLSKVRLGYQASLSNRSLESSILKQDLRRSQSMSTLKSGSSIDNTAGNNFSNLSISNTNRQNNFDLNKWFDELPAGLRNFVEIESSNNSADRNNSFRSTNSNKNELMKQNTMYENSADDKSNPVRENETESSNNQHGPVSDEKKPNEGTGGYFEKLTKDYINPIKKMFSEDLKNDIKDEIKYFKDDLTYLKEGIVDLYNKSPKMLQNLMNEESESELSANAKIEKKLLVNPNSYYLQSTRNTNMKTGSSTKAADGQGSKPKGSCKVFNIYDTYECFDISDQTKLTHVSAFDIKHANQNYSLARDDSDDDEGKVVTSISDYNIEFLSNLSKVNEKCNMLNSHKISCNLVKPWFTNPINEKIQINSNRSKLSRSSKVKTEEKHLVTDDNMKYVVKKTEGSVKYIIDEGSEPNVQDNKKVPINIYDMENYYEGVNYEYQNDEGKTFYDPISHFESVKDSKKKTLDNTEWAMFGRPLVKKTKETVLK